MQNYHSALEQLEKLQHERSLHMETPAGELREQVNSLSDTVEHLTSQNKDMEETAAIASQTIQELNEANKKLQYALFMLMHSYAICMASRSIKACTEWATVQNEAPRARYDHTGSQPRDIYASQASLRFAK